ncbi:MAG: hypothetical protein R3F54_30090 [Alphaproteobacteria bacterium]
MAAGAPTAISSSAYQALLPDIEAAGARLVAISPQTPDESLDRREERARLPGAVHTSSEAARAYDTCLRAAGGLYTDLYADSVIRCRVQRHRRLDPARAGDLLGADGLILLAHVDTDYRHRLEPRDALEADCGPPRRLRTERTAPMYTVMPSRRRTASRSRSPSNSGSTMNFAL